MSSSDSAAEIAELLVRITSDRERTESEASKGKGKGKIAALRYMYPGITPECIEICRAMQNAETMLAPLMQQAEEFHAAENSEWSLLTLTKLQRDQRELQQKIKKLHDELEVGAAENLAAEHRYTRW